VPSYDIQDFSIGSQYLVVAAVRVGAAVLVEAGLAEAVATFSVLTAFLDLIAHQAVKPTIPNTTTIRTASTAVKPFEFCPRIEIPLCYS
jgi:hypothetical protein